MKILVTGGVGFIGTNVCLEALWRGHEVVAFDNFVRPGVEENIPVLKGVEIVRGDIRSDKLPGADAIIHLAGQCAVPYSLANPRYDFEVNALGTINVLEHARSNKLPVAFASSNKVYTNISNQHSGAIDESLPMDAFGHARSLYGVSKAAGDFYAQEYYQAYGVPTVVNRMSCIYGLYQKGVEAQAWVDWFIRQIGFGDGKLNIYGDGEQVRDMLWGEDAARLFIDEIENIDKVKGQAYNIGGGSKNTMSLMDAIGEIQKVTAKKAKLTFKEKRHADQDIWVSDISKIKRDLGWEPIVSPQDGIKRMIDEYRRSN